MRAVQAWPRGRSWAWDYVLRLFTHATSTPSAHTTPSSPPSATQSQELQKQHSCLTRPHPATRSRPLCGLTLRPAESRSVSPASQHSTTESIAGFDSGVTALYAAACEQQRLAQLPSGRAAAPGSRSSRSALSCKHGPPSTVFVSFVGARASLWASALEQHKLCARCQIHTAAPGPPNAGRVPGDAGLMQLGSKAC